MTGNKVRIAAMDLGKMGLPHSAMVNIPSQAETIACEARSSWWAFRNRAGGRAIVFGVPLAGNIRSTEAMADKCIKEAA